MNDDVDEMGKARARVEALQRHLAKTATDTTECVETHSSWVVLSGEWVWKIKKPLDLGFLDYSTLALRRRYCEEEVRLNRRTAPELYVGVVALTRCADGVQPDGVGEALDYAVQMHRFPASALLATRLENGELEASHLDAVARHIADFHAAAASVETSAPWGRFAAVHEPVQQNFAQLRECLQENADVPAKDDLARLTRLERWSERTGQALAPVFAARRAAGRVRECHGDLHLANVVWLQDGPRLFDGIDFNPALRWTDVAADVAFLVMDLQARGRDDLAWGFLNAWVEWSGDHDALRVMRYYVVYRALVRAKVAAIRMEQTQGRERAAARDECGRYIQLAERASAPVAPVLFIAHGVSGSGKSVCAARLLAERAVIRVRADVERRRVAGLALDVRSSANPELQLYTPAMHARTYARLSAVGEAVIRAGWPVLLDATFLRRDGRDAMRALAKRCGVPCVIMACEAPVAVLRDRVARRLAQAADPSEADVNVLEGQLRTRQKLAADERAQAVIVDTSREIDWPAWLEAIDARCGWG